MSVPTVLAADLAINEPRRTNSTDLLTLSPLAKPDSHPHYVFALSRTVVAERTEGSLQFFEGCSRCPAFFTGESWTYHAANEREAGQWLNNTEHHGGLGSAAAALFLVLLFRSRPQQGWMKMVRTG